MINIEVGLLLHDDVLVDDGVGHAEGLEVEEVDVSALGSEKKVIAVGFEAHRRDLLQLTLQRERLGLDDRVFVDLPEVQRVVIAE